MLTDFKLTLAALSRSFLDLGKFTLQQRSLTCVMLAKRISLLALVSLLAWCDDLGPVSFSLSLLHSVVSVLPPPLDSDVGL